MGEPGAQMTVGGGFLFFGQPVDCKTPITDARLVAIGKIIAADRRNGNADVCQFLRALAGRDDDVAIFGHGAAAGRSVGRFRRTRNIGGCQRGDRCTACEDSPECLGSTPHFPIPPYASLP
jgi:hypothetical protein